MPGTLLILGAGSSKAIHNLFPTGLELAKLIDQHLFVTKKAPDNKEKHVSCPYESPMVNELFRVFGGEVHNNPTILDEILEHFKRQLWQYIAEYQYYDMRVETAPVSIDEFIMTKLEGAYILIIRAIAKYCIFYHIKGCEEAYCNRIEEGRGEIEKCWIYNLYSLARTMQESSENALKSLLICTFNYDRVFEYCSDLSIQKLHGSTSEEDRRILQFEIKHLYGVIGNNHDVPFCLKNNSKEFSEANIENLKLIEEDRTSISVNVNDFERVVLYGFGYNKRNLKYLQIIKGSNTEYMGYLHDRKDIKALELMKEYGIKEIKEEEVLSKLLEH